MARDAVLQGTLWSPSEWGLRAPELLLDSQRPPGHRIAGTSSRLHLSHGCATEDCGVATQHLSQCHIELLCAMQLLKSTQNLYLSLADLPIQSMALYYRRDLQVA